MPSLVPYLDSDDDPDNTQFDVVEVLDDVQFSDVPQPPPPPATAAAASANVPNPPAPPPAAAAAAPAAGRNQPQFELWPDPEQISREELASVEESFPVGEKGRKMTAEISYTMLHALRKKVGPSFSLPWQSDLDHPYWTRPDKHIHPRRRVSVNSAGELDRVLQVVEDRAQRGRFTSKFGGARDPTVDPAQPDEPDAGRFFQRHRVLNEQLANINHCWQRVTAVFGRPPTMDEFFEFKTLNVCIFWRVGGKRVANLISSIHWLATEFNAAAESDEYEYLKYQLPVSPASLLQIANKLLTARKNANRAARDDVMDYQRAQRQTGGMLTEEKHIHIMKSLWQSQLLKSLCNEMMNFDARRNQFNHDMLRKFSSALILVQMRFQHFRMDAYRQIRFFHIEPPWCEMHPDGSGYVSLLKHVTDKNVKRYGQVNMFFEPQVLCLFRRWCQLLIDVLPSLGFEEFLSAKAREMLPVFPAEFSPAFGWRPAVSRSFGKAGNWGLLALLEAIVGEPVRLKDVRSAQATWCSLSIKDTTTREAVALLARRHSDEVSKEFYVARNLRLVQDGLRLCARAAQVNDEPEAGQMAQAMPSQDLVLPAESSQDMVMPEASLSAAATVQAETLPKSTSQAGPSNASSCLARPSRPKSRFEQSTVPKKVQIGVHSRESNSSTEEHVPSQKRQKTAKPSGQNASLVRQSNKAMDRAAKRAATEAAMSQPVGQAVKAAILSAHEMGHKPGVNTVNDYVFMDPRVAPLMSTLTAAEKFVWMERAKNVWKALVTKDKGRQV